MLVTPADFELVSETSFDAVRDDGDALRLYFRGNELLVDLHGKSPAVPDGHESTVNGIVVGRWQGRLVVAFGDSGEPASEATTSSANTRWTGLRGLFGIMPDEVVALAGRATQLLEWDRTHRFCGACATPTIRDASERARRCPSCRHTAYPRISPAMMCLITRDQEILLARNVNFPAGRYSALAGFLEAGESIEDAIHREVEEEVGLKVTNLRYFSSQSWPFPHSLMIAFTAEFAGGELRPNGHEIAEADWFRHDALPQLPPRISIARALIDDTVRKMAEC